MGGIFSTLVDVAAEAKLPREIEACVAAEATKPTLSQRHLPDVAADRRRQATRRRVWRMNRIEVEIKLNRDRAWMLERLAGMDEAELHSPRTHSEHDPESTWSYADHFVHTTLIERNWNDMFRRHLRGDEGLPPRLNTDGSRQTMPEIMAGIHAWTEEWKREHTGKPLAELVRLGLATRAETLALLAELSDDDLASKIPGAPWADGTVGGIMAANADHGRIHFGWATEDPVSNATRAD